MGEAKRRLAAESEADARQHAQKPWRALVWGLVMVVGFGYAIVAGAHMESLSSKAERLRGNGIETVAAVSDLQRRAGRGGRDKIAVSYTYDGREYRKRILCGGPTGCNEVIPPQMTLWLDPAAPAEFVADNGHTDQSVSFLNAPAAVPWGIGVGLFGTLLLVLLFFGDRIFGRSRNAG